MSINGPRKAGLSLQPTELQPREPKITALELLREDIAALGQTDPLDPLHNAHLTVALLKIARRLDELEAAA